MTGSAAERRFLEGLAGRPAPAIVLGSGLPHVLAFVRSLGRRGVPVAAVIMEAGGRLRSRYCRLERAMGDDADLLGFLERLGSCLPQPGVLLPAGDAAVLFLLEHRVRLERPFRFVLPAGGMLDRLADKRFQYEYAARSGVPTPRTYCPGSEAELGRIAADIRYPCVVKPAYSHRWREYRRRAGGRLWEKAAPAHTADELWATYTRMSDAGVPLLVQERIEGPESALYSLYAYLDRQSRTRAAVVLQKRRQWPPVYGTGSYSVTCRQDAVVALGSRLLEDVGYQGIANIEFKQDARDGALKLIEVNVRGGNRMALAMESGVDLPFIAYRDACGEPVAPAGDYEVGVTWIDLLYDLAAFPHYRRGEGLTLWQWMRSALRARSHSYWARDDPLPFLAHAGRVARRALAWTRS